MLKRFKRTANYLNNGLNIDEITVNYPQVVEGFKSFSSDNKKERRRYALSLGWTKIVEQCIYSLLIVQPKYEKKEGINQYAVRIYRAGVFIAHFVVFDTGELHVFEAQRGEKLPHDVIRNAVLELSDILLSKDQCVFHLSGIRAYPQYEDVIRAFERSGTVYAGGHSVRLDRTKVNRQIQKGGMV